MAFAIPMAATALGASAGTAATLGTIASIVGTGMSVFGALQSGKAASDSAKYQAAVAANNATIAQQNATRAGQEGEQQAFIAEQKNRAKVGALMADQAASGIDVNKGSALDIRQSEAQVGQLDAMTIRANAAQKAYGYQVDSASQTANAGMYKAEAKSAKTASYINAATILGSNTAKDYKVGGGYDGFLDNFSIGGGGDNVGTYSFQQRLVNGEINRFVR